MEGIKIIIKGILWLALLVVYLVLNDAVGYSHGLLNGEPSVLLDILRSTVGTALRMIGGVALIIFLCIKFMKTLVKATNI